MKSPMLPQVMSLESILVGAEVKMKEKSGQEGVLRQK